MTLDYSDPDGPGGPYTFMVVQGPANGSLGSDDGDAFLTYTPAEGKHGVMFAEVDGDGLPDLYLTIIAGENDPKADLFFLNLGGALLGMRESRGNQRYLSQDDPTLHFELGPNTSVNALMRFHDGTEVILTGVFREPVA